MKQERLYFLGIKAIIQNPLGQILLLKHVKGHWDFPGGRINHGETALETLLREVNEETGLTALDTITPDAMVLMPVNIPTDSEKSAGLILWYHTCKLRADNHIVLSDEHVEYAWVDVHQAKSMTKIHASVAPLVFGG